MLIKITSGFDLSDVCTQGLNIMEHSDYEIVIRVHDTDYFEELALIGPYMLENDIGEFTVSVSMEEQYDEIM